VNLKTHRVSSAKGTKKPRKAASAQKKTEDSDVAALVRSLISRLPRAYLEEAAFRGFEAVSFVLRLWISVALGA